MEARNRSCFPSSRTTGATYFQSPQMTKAMPPNGRSHAYRSFNIASTYSDYKAIWRHAQRLCHPYGLNLRCFSSDCWRRLEFTCLTFYLSTYIPCYKWAYATMSKSRILRHQHAASTCRNRSFFSKMRVWWSCLHRTYIIFWRIFIERHSRRRRDIAWPSYDQRL